MFHALVFHCLHIGKGEGKSFLKLTHEDGHQQGGSIHSVVQGK